MRSIGKQFSHTVRFQHEELVDAKSSTSKILPLVIVAVYLVTACHGMSRHIGSQILLSRYMSYSHIILLSRYMYHIKMRNTTLLLQPPTPSPSQRPSRSSPPICSLSLPPPPSSLFGSNVQVYIFLRASKVEGNNFRLSFWVHSLPLVTRKPNYESFKHGMQNMGKVNELLHLNFDELSGGIQFFLRLFWETTLLIRHRINCSNSLCESSRIIFQRLR